MSVHHFLNLADWSSAKLEQLVARAIELKAMRQRGEQHAPLQNKVLGMVFEKASTRTRVSFESAMIQMGGGAIFLSPRDTQLGRGEPVEDTARVLSRMVDGLMVRTFAHEKIERFAASSSVPVINALTDYSHPCQLLADIQTYVEHRGSMAGRTVAWIGDGNNMCHSYMEAALRFGFKLRIACPEGFDPDSGLLAESAAVAEIVRDPLQAAEQADLVVTDVWASMGQEEEQMKRERAFDAYQVNSKVMACAKADALFMHCLPAHRGEEVSTAVIDGSQSVVWDEAENRLHAQKALLERLMAS